MPIPLSTYPRRNLLLASLPPTVRERIAPRLHPVLLSSGETILESREPIDAVYFPTGAVVSFQQKLAANGLAAVGLALAGKEGVVGIELVLGGETTINHTKVHVAGEALRIEAQPLREEFGRGAALQRLLLRYTRAFLVQVSQTSACERQHSIEQRLVRWLLLTADRVKSRDLQLTQEDLSHLLGARRESVSLAAGHLQEAGLIDYRRGKIVILDRSRLDTRACECYVEIRAEYDRMLEEI